MIPVAALYIDPRGPYPKLLGPEMCWDAARDAQTYDESLPIVAHPPCGPWGRLRHFCTRQLAVHAVHAVHAVRVCGGVLEHPAHSKLFEAMGLPRPGELPDRFGGITIRVDQCDYGHVSRKPTWLYLVGIRHIDAVPPKRTPTHWISGSRDRRVKGRRGICPPGIKICSAQQRRRTPVAFAEWLISLARTARV